MDAECRQSTECKQTAERTWETAISLLQAISGTPQGVYHNRKHGASFICMRDSNGTSMLWYMESVQLVVLLNENWVLPFRNVKRYGGLGEMALN